jgi:transcriptional regulator with XRE-family HTH domain
MAGKMSKTKRISLATAIQRTGQSLRQIAPDAGIDHSTLSRIVAGNRSPRLVTAQAIAQALGLSVDAIIWPKPPA